MSHIVGRGRYGRETYPGRGSSGAPASNEILRFYGGAAVANVASVQYAGTVTGDTVWSDFTQDNVLQQGGKLVAPSEYLITSLNVKRVITGGAGPIVGDTDITLELLQSTDNGVTWGNPGGGAAITVTFAPDETADKSASFNAVVPTDALITVRATYPANYDPQGQDEVLLIVVGVG